MNCKWHFFTCSVALFTLFGVGCSGSADVQAWLTPGGGQVPIPGTSSGGSLPPPGGPSSGAQPRTSWVRQVWSLDVSQAPVDPRSNDFISFINADSTKRLHPGIGGDISPGSDENWGMPYLVTDGRQPKKSVRFLLYPNQSDGVDHGTGRNFPFYPIPDEAISTAHLIQNGPPGYVDMRWEDRHMLIVDRDNNFLYELYNVYFNRSTEEWEAGGGAFFDMDSSDRRPEGWTSADASGLPIFPSLLRYEEVYGAGEIDHAFRVTVRATNRYVYPASHEAGDTAQALPMGARLRLKSSTDLSRFAPDVQKVFRAMQRYGLIVADNGGDMNISGTYDRRWNNDLFNPAFNSLSAWDFEVIQLGYHP